MTQAQMKLLSDIFTDPDLVTPDDISDELESLGFNYEEFSQKVLNKIRNLKREALYEEGKKKINKYYVLLSGLKEKLQVQKSDAELESEIRFAFNKLDGLTEEDIKEILDDQKKMLLLKDIINQKNIEE